MLISDWSSDVGSSDLRVPCRLGADPRPGFRRGLRADVALLPGLLAGRVLLGLPRRPAGHPGPIRRAHQWRGPMSGVATRIADGDRKSNTSELQSIMRI